MFDDVEQDDLQVADADGTAVLPAGVREPAESLSEYIPASASGKGPNGFGIHPLRHFYAQIGNWWITYDDAIVDEGGRQSLPVRAERIEEGALAGAYLAAGPDFEEITPLFEGARDEETEAVRLLLRRNASLIMKSARNEVASRFPSYHFMKDCGVEISYGDVQKVKKGRLVDEEVRVRFERMASDGSVDFAEGNLLYCTIDNSSGFNELELAGCVALMHRHFGEIHRAALDNAVERGLMHEEAADIIATRGPEPSFVLGAEDFEAFAKQLEKPMSPETGELIKRSPRWADIGG